MPLIDTSRLDKLLAMLTSGFGGEQANAASLIAKMAADHKLTVPELMEAAVLQKRGHDPPPRQPDPQPQPAYDFNRDINGDNAILTKLRIIATQCPHILSPWELNWSLDVAGRYSTDDRLSPRQLAIANRILFKFDTVASREWSNI